MKKNLLLGIFALTMGLMKAQTVNIPDANFKAYLVGNSEINTSYDDEIQVSEATAFTGEINVNDLNITDLTGIEAFVNLTYLYCANNNLSTVNIGNKPNLKYLGLDNNFLTSIDLSSCPVLEGVQINNNLLTTLDVSNNHLLEWFNAKNNNLTSIDVSGEHSLLFQIYVPNNQITSLDISHLNTLSYLHLAYNPITELDLSNIQFIPPPFTPSFLGVYNCDNLTSLNIKNGGNINMDYILAFNNPNLTCIQVDNAEWSETNWNDDNYFKFDEWVSFSEDCNYMSVTDNQFSKIMVYPNPTTGIINFGEEVKGVKVFDMTGKMIKSFNGSVNKIDISNLSKGNYVVYATDKNGNKTNQKIIKK